MNQVRMAHLGIVGSFSINGVAQLHTDILTHIEMKDFYDIIQSVLIIKQMELHTVVGYYTVILN